MWLFALLSLSALAAGLLALWSIGIVRHLGNRPISTVLRFWCNQQAVKPAPSSPSAPTAAPVQPPVQPPVQHVTLRVFGLSLGNGKSASSAVSELFQTLLGTAVDVPTLATSTPWLSHGGRWAVCVSVPSTLAKVIRARQPFLAVSRDTTHVSIYRRQKWKGPRCAGRPYATTTTGPHTYRPPPPKPPSPEAGAGGLAPHPQQPQPQPVPTSTPGQSVDGPPQRGPPLLPLPSALMRAPHHPQLQHVPPITQTCGLPRHLQVCQTPGCGRGACPLFPQPQPQPPCRPLHPPMLLASLLERVQQLEAVVALPGQQGHDSMPCQVATAKYVGEDPSPCTPPFAGTAVQEVPLSPPPAPNPDRLSCRAPCPKIAAIQQRFARLQQRQSERERQLEHEQQLDQFLADLGMDLPPPPPPTAPQLRQQLFPVPQPPPSSLLPATPPPPTSPPPFPPPKGSDWEVRRVVGHKQTPSGGMYYWVQWGDSWVQQAALREDTLRGYWQLRGEEPPQPAPRCKQRDDKGRGSKAVAQPRQQPRQQPASLSSLLELD